MNWSYEYIAILAVVLTTPKDSVISANIKIAVDGTNPCNVSAVLPSYSQP